MILPIYAYGTKILKKECREIDRNYKDLSHLLDNMWETMYNAQGVGLAAPQIGLDIRLFVVDTIQAMEPDDKDKGIKQVFINAWKIEEDGNNMPYEEGCLSIPNIRADVIRPETITLEYMDEEFNLHQKTFEGINARVIQHEYDHTDGILFTEKIAPLKRRLIKRKLEGIRKGEVQVEYRMKFARLK